MIALAQCAVDEGVVLLHGNRQVFDKVYLDGIGFKHDDAMSTIWLADLNKPRRKETENKAK